MERDLVGKLIGQDSTLQLSYAKKIIGLRNRISHPYDSVKDEWIWTIIQNDIPLLQIKMQKIKSL